MNPPSLTQVRQEFERYLAYILDAARAAQVRAADWQRVRDYWTPGAIKVQPAPNGAAHPAELREVLVALRQHFQDRLVEAVGEPASDADWEFQHRVLDDFVRDCTEAYIAEVSTPPSIGGVFQSAAAQAQAAPQAAPAGPSAGMWTCANCRAPRQKDQPYGNCAFCGAPFYPSSGG